MSVEEEEIEHLFDTTPNLDAKQDSIKENNQIEG